MTVDSNLTDWPPVYWHWYQPYLIVPVSVYVEVFGVGTSLVFRDLFTGEKSCGHMSNEPTHTPNYLRLKSGTSQQLQNTRARHPTVNLTNRPPVQRY